MYRPEGFKNPYSLTGYLHPDTYELANKLVHNAYEDGADAMLEGLKSLCDKDGVKAIVFLINPDNGDIEPYILPEEQR